MENAESITALLSILHIPFRKEDHIAVFSTEAVKQVELKLQGTNTKNLFLCDEKRALYYLVVVNHEKRVDLKALSRILGVKGLTMGTPERLIEYLGVTPGSVTLLGLIHDTHQKVRCVIDEEVWTSSALLLHPLVNTSTIEVARSDIARFLDHVRHPPTILTVPSKKLQPSAIGATVIEAMITITTFFLFIGGAISLASIILTSLLADEALRTAVRTVVPTAPTTCLERIQSTLNESTLARALRLSFATLNGTSSAALTASSSQGRFLQFSIVAHAPCPLCPLISLGHTTTYPVHARALSFLGDNLGCADVPAS